MRPIRDGDKWHGTLLLLVLALVLLLGEFEGNVGHVIPGVVDADEQEQHRCRGDDEQCRCWMAWKHNCRDDEGGVGDQRQDHIPQPVFQHRLIVHLKAACPPERDDNVGRPPRPARPSSRPAVQSACQGALRSAATSSAAPKCTTFCVLNTAIPLLGDDTRTRLPAIKVITTNSKPVSVAAAVPMM